DLGSPVLQRFRRQVGAYTLDTHESTLLGAHSEERLAKVDSDRRTVALYKSESGVFFSVQLTPVGLTNLVKIEILDHDEALTLVKKCAAPSTIVKHFGQARVRETSAAQTICARVAAWSRSGIERTAI